jgi:hypothetical protein
VDVDARAGTAWRCHRDLGFVWPRREEAPERGGAAVTRQGGRAAGEDHEQSVSIGGD